MDLFLTLGWKTVATIIFGSLVLRLAGRKSLSQMTIAQTVVMLAVGTVLIEPLVGTELVNTYVVVTIAVVTQIRLLPVIPGVFLYDYTVIPLYYMLAYQYSSNWKSFLFWNTALAGFIGLVFFPTLVAVDIVFYRNWLPIYQAVAPFIFGILNRAIVLGTLKAEQKRLGYSPSEVGFMVHQPATKPLRDKEKGQD